MDLIEYYTESENQNGCLVQMVSPCDRVAAVGNATAQRHERIWNHTMTASPGKDQSVVSTECLLYSHHRKVREL